MKQMKYLKLILLIPELLNRNRYENRLYKAWYYHIEGCSTPLILMETQHSLISIDKMITYLTLKNK